MSSLLLFFCWQMHNLCFQNFEKRDMNCKEINELTILNSQLLITEQSKPASGMTCSDIQLDLRPYAILDPHAQLPLLSNTAVLGKKFSAQIKIWSEYVFVDTLKRIVNICNLPVKRKDERCRQQGKKSVWIIALVSFSLLCLEQKCPMAPVLFFLHKEATYIDLECYFILVPHFSCHRSHL